MGLRWVRISLPTRMFVPRLTCLSAGRSVPDLTCAALACTHEAEASSSFSPACPLSWNLSGGWKLGDRGQQFDVMSARQFGR